MIYIVVKIVQSEKIFLNFWKFDFILSWEDVKPWKGKKAIIRD